MSRKQWKRIARRCVRHGSKAVLRGRRPRYGKLLKDDIWEKPLRQSHGKRGRKPIRFRKCERKRVRSWKEMVPYV
jgi:hypothetical protein